MSSPRISVLDALREPPPQFQAFLDDPEALARSMKPPVPRTDSTTTKWAIAHLKKVDISSSPMQKEDLSGWDVFMSALEETFVDHPANVSNPICYDPKGEADIHMFIHVQLAIPVHDILTRAKDEEGHNPFMLFASDIKIPHVEVEKVIWEYVHEKVAHEPHAQVAVDAPMERKRKAEGDQDADVSNRLGKRRRTETGRTASDASSESKSSPSTPESIANAADNAMLDNPQTSASYVRTDAAFLHSLKVAKEDLNEVARPTSKSIPISLGKSHGTMSSTREFLSQKNVWNSATCYETHKASGPIEAKAFGMLNEATERLKAADAVGRSKAGDNLQTGGRAGSTLKALSTAERGLISIFQQGIRYGWYYGTRHILLVDAQQGILLQLPEGWDNAAGGSGPRTGSKEAVEWTLFDRNELGIHELEISSVYQGHVPLLRIEKCTIQY